MVNPAAVTLVPDLSPVLEDARLFLEAAFRGKPPVSDALLAVGRAANRDLAFQHEPVQRILAQPRTCLLVADDVDFRKTLETGLIAAELILRVRAKRILVVTTRAMLLQFQKAFWTRFAIHSRASTSPPSGACANVCRHTATCSSGSSERSSRSTR